MSRVADEARWSKSCGSSQICGKGTCATSMDAEESGHENVCDDCKHELVSSVVDVKPFLIEIYVEQNSNIRIL